MDLGAHLFDPLEQLDIIGKRQVRMNSADHVDLDDGLIKSLTHLVLDLLNAHLIGQLVFLLPAEGAELTEIGADIGIVDVLVVDEIGVVAVFPFPDHIGQIADGQDVRAVW